MDAQQTVVRNPIWSPFNDEGPPSAVGLKKASSHPGGDYEEKVVPRSPDRHYKLHFQPVGLQDTEGFEGTALPFCSARVLKAQVRHRCRELAAVPDQRIRLLYRGVELPNDDPVVKHLQEDNLGSRVDLQFIVLGLERDDGRMAAEDENSEFVVCKGVPCSEVLMETIHDCSDALKKGILPELACGGTGGVYLLGDVNDRIIGVFKPKDEEAGAPQNPHGWEGRENTRGVRPGVASAQRAAREVAAFLLDHDGFAGVPMTSLVRGKHPSFVPLQVFGEGRKVVWKVGAFQTFINTTETAGNFGHDLYEVDDVHKVGILDVRLTNFDRNEGNLLVVPSHDGDGQRRLRLVPIDHGCSLPDRFVICQEDVVWMGWPQAKEPFSEKSLKYIENLNPKRDATMLSEKLGLERCGLRILEVTTTWLQVAAARALTLHEIGTALYRDDATPSILSAVEIVLENSIKSAITYTNRKAATATGMFRTVTCEPSVPLTSDPLGAVFVRFDDRGKVVEWSRDLETTFSRHMFSALDQLARENAAGRPPPVRVAESSVSAEKSEEVDEGLKHRSANAWRPRHARLSANDERVPTTANEEVDGGLIHRSANAWRPRHTRLSADDDDGVPTTANEDAVEHSEISRTTSTWRPNNQEKVSNEATHW